MVHGIHGSVGVRILTAVALVTHLPNSDYQAMPWPNGAGTTHQIAIDDALGDSQAPFLWRLSMTDLAGDGPFSEIPDVDRILVLIEGDGVELTIAGGGTRAAGRARGDCLCGRRADEFDDGVAGGS